MPSTILDRRDRTSFCYGIGARSRPPVRRYRSQSVDHAVKTAIDRAAEAMEAAETLFADEMGATLDLSRAAKAVLMATIAAAIEAAVAEERERLVCAQ